MPTPARLLQQYLYHNIGKSMRKAYRGNLVDSGSISELLHVSSIFSDVHMSAGNRCHCSKSKMSDLLFPLTSASAVGLIGFVCETIATVTRN